MSTLTVFSQILAFASLFIFALTIVVATLNDCTSLGERNNSYGNYVSNFVVFSRKVWNFFWVYGFIVFSGVAVFIQNWPAAIFLGIVAIIFYFKPYLKL